MITTDKVITTPEYWDRIYTGNNNNAKVDASNTVRPANTFDRFSWVAKYAEGPAILGVASGHAHIEKRIKAANPTWRVIASDQAPAAAGISRYPYYEIFNAYSIPYDDDSFSTIICAQALEYMENETAFLNEAKRVAQWLLLTVPIGEMEKWSQLRIYTEEYIETLLMPYGNMMLERQGDLLLAKLKFEKGL